MPYLVVGVSISLLMLFPSYSISQLAKLTMWVVDAFGLGFILFASAMFAVSIAIGMSRVGKVKLGGKTAVKEFTTFSWIAMLFTAGMGSGLIFWGVAEPAFHFANQPAIAKGFGDSLNTSLSLTYFHWGFHAWSIYTLSGLAIAWFSFNRGRSLKISSSFTEDDNKYKWLNWIAIVAIIFGVAGTVANSIALAETGLLNLFSGASSSFGLRLVVILALALCFTLSSALGLQKGIKRISLFNTLVMILLLGFVFIYLDPLNITKLMLSSFVRYIEMLPALSFTIEDASRQWSLDWSVIYIVWWVAWTPFVGTFIARISKGRTVREFLVASICVPTFASIFWFSSFGGEALTQNVAAHIVQLVGQDYTLGLFEFFKLLPASVFLSVVAILLLLTFVVTSADSAIIVCCILGDNESQSAKLVWALPFILLSAILVYINDVDLNKQVAIAGALPFTLIIVCQVFMMIKDMIQQRKKLATIDCAEC